MTQRPENGGKLRGYLLGSLSEEESAELELRYFSDDALYEELLAEETEILDAWTSGALPEDERRRFERFLETSPRLRKRAALANSLLRLERPPRSRVPLAPLLLAAGIVLAVGSLWVVRSTQRGSPAAEVAVSRESPVPAVVPSAVPPAAGIPRDAHVVSFVLAAGLTRGASAVPLAAVPHGTTAVELRLLLEADEHPVYSAEVRTAAGAEVLTRGGLRARVEKGRRIGRPGDSRPQLSLRGVPPDPERRKAARPPRSPRAVRFPPQDGVTRRITAAPPGGRTLPSSMATSIASRSGSIPARPGAPPPGSAAPARASRGRSAP